MNDSFFHDSLDRILAIATQVFRMPIAFISIVEPDRQLLVAKKGINISEMSRESAFCDPALNSRALMIVPDSLLDGRCSENVLVRGKPFIRFFAGCPLVSPRGFVFGTICISDTVPRFAFNLRDQLLLRDLAALAEAQLERRSADLGQNL